MPPKLSKVPKADYNRVFNYISSSSAENAKASDVREFFRQLFKEQFSYEADASNADGYVRGRMVIELKGAHEDWLPGFYQALHYAKKGLGFAHITVLANNFIGLWRVNNIPEFAKKLANNTPPLLAASEAGRENARKGGSKADKAEILASAEFLFKELHPEKLEVGKGALTNAHVYLQKLRYLDEERIPVTLNTFLQVIEALEQFFPSPLEAVHAFYDMVNYWDITSTVATDQYKPDHVRVVGKKGSFLSEPIALVPTQQALFKRFVEQHYIFTNEGSGITTDDYFARFDEVMARIVPEYVRQHGIFFTDLRLARFALWFTDTYYDAGLTDNYVVLDPAGGSGNLVSSWRKHIQHKIVAELQPDLLRIIDRRFRADEEEALRGFTIVPRVAENRGLNFLDQPAAAYYQHLLAALAPEGRTLDKPLAFLLNPPYKNTDEGQTMRDENEAGYAIDPGILELTGPDAGNERYLGFLGQITRLAQAQVAEHPDFRPVLLVFTPTSWLIPRPTYAAFRSRFDQHWQYETGFLTTSNEFFKLKGKWPLAYTIWKWRSETDPDATNIIAVRDLTNLKKQDLDKVFALPEEELTRLLRNVVEDASEVVLGRERPTIAEWTGQPMYDFKRDPTKAEKKVGGVIGGLPLSDERRNNKKTYGIPDSPYIGFMDNITPVRVKQDKAGRMSNIPDRVWFRLDLAFSDFNKTKIFNGPPDNRGYCAYDLASARACFSWFAITKAFNSNYPGYANQLNAWAPDFTHAPAMEEEFYRLCFAFGLAENRCVVLRFEADNPVPGAPAVTIGNPLACGDPASFWEQVLAPEFAGQPATDAAVQLVTAVRAVYSHWATAVCGGQTLPAPELHDEAYFRYFSIEAARLTPRAGLVQIRAYAAKHTGEEWYPELQKRLTRLAELRESVKADIHRLLTKDLRYFA